VIQALLFTMDVPRGAQRGTDSNTLNYQDRTGHLPARGRPRPPAAPRCTAPIPISSAAREHGVLRRTQAILSHGCGRVANLAGQHFQYSHSNIGSVDFSTLLLDVMTIADEVDSQLKQAMLASRNLRPRVGRFLF